jgi:LPXTG-motif cell wall-anchored protein
VDPATASADYTWLVWAGVILAAGLLLFGFVVARKGRRVPGEHVFRASRLSKGNRLLPAQVSISPHSITLYQPQWIGKLEESIHMSHISSIKIDTNLLFSSVLIESTGGHHPIVCHGHTKGDAIEIKKTIEKYQTEYFGTRT